MKMGFKSKINRAGKDMVEVRRENISKVLSSMGIAKDKIDETNALLEEAYKEVGEEQFNGLLLTKKMEGFLEVLFGKENSEKFLDSLAWVAQNRGEKLRWAPLIRTTPVIRTLLTDLLTNHVFGKANTKVVSTRNLTNGDNKCATECLCMIIEEVHTKKDGGKRVLASIKNYTEVEKVYVARSRYEVGNEGMYANLLAFTEHEKLIDEVKGRHNWWAINSNINSMEELAKHSSIPVEYYLATLQAFVRADSPHAKYFNSMLMKRDVKDLLPWRSPDTKD